MDGEKILIIEDDNTLRKSSSKLLSIAGYGTLEANSRNSAIEMLQSYPDVNTILLDISMPGMTVDAFISHIEKMYPNIRVIFSSGRLQDEITDSVPDRSKNYRFLPKPYGLEELKEALNSYD